jgi:hypothetical protein
VALSSRNDKHDLALFLTLRMYSRRFLVVAAAILSGATLGSAALRVAVNTDRNSEVMPKEYVIIYGAAYSALLLVVYFPVRVALARWSAALTALLAGESTEANITEWLTRQKTLADFFTPDFANILPALVPLLTGWLSTLLSEAAKRSP